MSSIDNILRFVEFVQRFRAIERRVLVKGQKRRENDAEHSFSLAVLAWYINSTYRLGLNTEKLLLYSLAHDLVEVYAGDTFFYQTDKKDILDKQIREEEAMANIKQEFPEFSDLHDILEKYEAKEDEESVFIYALDKIEPVLNIYLDGGRTWRADKVSLSMLKEHKIPKVKTNKSVEEIFDDLLMKLDIDKNKLFEGVNDEK